MENTELIESSDFLRIAQELEHNQAYIDVANRIARDGKLRIILDRESNEEYLYRYYYLNFRPFARIVLHKFIRSDIDGLHDHPWGFSTYVLSGGYWETTQKGTFWRAPGYYATQPSNFLHRISVDADKAGEDTWTLFMMGSKEKDWGFLDDNDRWVQWKEYLNNKRQ
jgi:hypothetical protein